MTSDAIQPYHPLLPPSLALNLSQHQSFPMSWLLHQVANVLELQLKQQYVLKLLKNTQNWNRIKHLYTSGPKLFGLCLSGTEEWNL